MFERAKRNHKRIKKTKIKVRDRFGKSRKSRDAEKRSIEQLDEEFGEFYDKYKKV